MNGTRIGAARQSPSRRRRAAVAPGRVAAALRRCGVSHVRER